MKEPLLDAYYIQNPGACNARGVARALVQALDYEFERGGREAMRDSAAVRLIMHQLCWLLWGTDPYWGHPVFNGATYERDWAQATEAYARYEQEKREREEREAREAQEAAA